MELSLELFEHCSDSDSKSNSTNWTWLQILGISKFEKGPRAEYYQCRASTASDVGIKLHGCGTANVAVKMWQCQCGSDSGVVWQRQENTGELANRLDIGRARVIERHSLEHAMFETITTNSNTKEKRREHRQAYKQAEGRVIERNMQQRHRCVQNNYNKDKRQRQNT